MFSNHFYHETIRDTVAVFGTLFNDMSIIRKDSAGEVLGIIKVPLSYGPKQKFLARIDEQLNLDSATTAIKLPRMSFELTSLTYDTNTKLQKGLKQVVTLPAQDPNAYSKRRVLGPVNYRLGIQLNIYGKNMDDVLQVLEQILPYFQPEYTVTVKQVDNNFKTDMPFVLTSVSITDDYEGDMTTRRSIIYTLEFETRVRFYGSVNEGAVIRQTSVDVRDLDTQEMQSRVKHILNPFDADPDGIFSVDVNQSFGNLADEYNLTVSSAVGFEVGDIVSTENSLSEGQVKSIDLDNNIITVFKPDGLFVNTDRLIRKVDGTATNITTVEEVWYE